MMQNITITSTPAYPIPINGEEAQSCSSVEKIKEVALRLFRILMVVGASFVGLHISGFILIPAASLSSLKEITKTLIKHKTLNKKLIKNSISKGLIKGLNTTLVPTYTAFKLLGIIYARVSQGLDSFLDCNISEIRADYPPSVRKFIEKFGNTPIDNITVCRTLVDPILKKLGNILTCGQLDQAIQSAGYDEIYHTLLLINMGGMRVLCEKNEVIDISPSSYSNKGISIHLEKSVTLKKFLNRGKETQGDKFFLYSPFSNNCQNFVDTLLTANQINNPEITKYALQNGKLISKGLKSCQKSLIKQAISIASMADFLIMGP